MLRPDQARAVEGADLVSTLRTECAAVEAIACAHVSENHQAFVIQTRVTQHRVKGDKDWLHVTPRFAHDGETTRALSEILERLKRRFPDVDGVAVSYRFETGTWEEVYRRDAE